MAEIQEENISGLATSFQNIYAFFVAFIVILNSGYYRSTAKDSYLPLILFMCFIFGAFFLKFPNVMEQKIDLTVTLLAMGIVFSVLANPSLTNALSGFRVLITMFCAYIFTHIVTLQDFVKYFTVQIKVIIVLSVLLQLLMLAGVSNFPKLNNYYDLFIVTTRSSDRACGVFWEPGVFSSMIVISMLFEYYISKNKITVSGLLLYILGIYITKSAAGYLLLFIVLFGLVWQKTTKSNKKHFYTIIFIAIIVSVAITYENIVVFLVDLNPDVFEKLIETNSATTSTRINSPLINLQIFLDKPVFGWGFTGSSAEFLQRVHSINDTKIVAQTSTSTQIMASIGILGVVYTIAFLIPAFSKKKLAQLPFETKALISICMLLIVNKEPHVFIVASWLVLFYTNQSKEMIL